MGNCLKKSESEKNDDKNNEENDDKNKEENDDKNNEENDISIEKIIENYNKQHKIQINDNIIEKNCQKKDDIKNIEIVEIYNTNNQFALIRKNCIYKI